MAHQERGDLAGTVCRAHHGLRFGRTLDIERRDLIDVRLSPIDVLIRIRGRVDRAGFLGEVIGYGDEDGLRALSGELTAQVDEGILIVIGLIIDDGRVHPGGATEDGRLATAEKRRLSGAGIIEEAALGSRPAAREPGL